jgi:predicted enzyme related to lactoylglutathione lyase
MVNFYSKVFGWQAHIPGCECGNYVTVTTIETGEDGRMKEPAGNMMTPANIIYVKYEE